DEFHWLRSGEPTAYTLFMCKRRVACAFTRGIVIAGRKPKQPPGPAVQGRFWLVSALGEVYIACMDNTEYANAIDPSHDRRLDPEVCRRARLSRDARFDGEFYLAVHTTGIYCRPICPARAPAEKNVHY